MDETRRRQILDEARGTLDRLEATPLEPRPRHIEVEERDARWKREGEERMRHEAAQRVAASDGAATAAWQQWVADQISTGVRAAAIGVAEAVAERLNDLEDAIAQRNEKLKKFELELVQALAEIARMKVRMAEVDLDRDRERSTAVVPPLRRDLN